MKRRYESNERKLSSGKVLRTRRVNRPTYGKALASRLLAQMRKARPEVKVLDTLAVNNFNGQLIIPLHQIEQGVDQDDRIGNKVTATGVYFRALIRVTEPADVAAQAAHRIIIFRDNQQVGDSDPTAAALLSQPTTFPLTTPLLRQNFGRFQVLCDEVLLRNQGFPTGNGVASDYAQPFYFQKYLKMNHEIRYNGGAATDINKGGIYVLILSAAVTGAAGSGFGDALSGADVNNRVAISYYGRLTYTDS